MEKKDGVAFCREDKDVVKSLAVRLFFVYFLMDNRTKEFIQMTKSLSIVSRVPVLPILYYFSTKPDLQT